MLLAWPAGANDSDSQLSLTSGRITQSIPFARSFLSCERFRFVSRIFRFKRGGRGEFRRRILASAARFACRDFRGATLDRLEQPLARQLPVAHLRARVLHGHAETGRAMTQGDSGGDLIYVLPAWA